MNFCGVAFSAEPIEPDRFVPDGNAQTIPTAAEIVPTNALRWQAKRLDTSVAQEPVETSTSAMPIGSTASRPLRAGWNVTRIDPGVRPAQAVSVDPFTDPFGDRQAGKREATLTLQPSNGEAVVETLPPPRSSSALRRSTSQPPLLTTAQPTDGLPAPGPAMPPDLVSGTPCDRIYNDRNCCDLESRCNDFRDRLLADNIRRISLDITPRYNPSAEVTPEQELAERTDKLRLLESRPWRDRRGQLVATGKMTNIHNGFVIVADDSGREVGRVGLNELGQDELCYVNAWWELPAECGLGGLRHIERQWIPSTFAWHASALCHKPLYFEEVQLERYGHTAGPIRQPILSAAHFCKNLICLPYHMGINPVNECQYALGYYRPGSCAPWMIDPIPLSLRGAIAETAVILGGVYVIP